MRRYDGLVREYEVIERRWAAYVCPECRIVFRMPQAHDGKGVVCPSCQRVLRIPTAGDQPPPLVAAPSADSLEVAANAQFQGNGGGRHLRGHDNYQWEQQPKAQAAGERKWLRGLMIGGGLLFVIAVVAISVLFKDGAMKKPVAPVIAKRQPQAPAAVSAAVDQGRRLPNSAEAEELVKKFTAAKKVEEILPLICHPELSEPRIRKLYPTGEIPAVGMTRFDFDPTNHEQEGVYKGFLVTGDFLNKVIFFIQNESSLKIDWESWADYSEVSWSEFLAAKSTEPQTMRVSVVPDAYYNYEYKDEVKWQSYRISSADETHFIHGYVEKNGPLDRSLKSEDPSQYFLLSMRFLESSNSTNQVLIEKIVAKSWVKSEISR